MATQREATHRESGDRPFNVFWDFGFMRSSALGLGRKKRNLVGAFVDGQGNKMMRRWKAEIGEPVFPTRSQISLRRGCERRSPRVRRAATAALAR
jgi:hypothetical protein